MKSAAKIAAELAALKQMRPLVPQFTMFGEDNHAAIDAQIWVLENPLRTEAAIYERYQPMIEDDDEGLVHDESGDGRHALDNALETHRWIKGEEKESPSQGWRPLCKKAELIVVQAPKRRGVLLTSKQAKQFNVQHKAPCSDCPWSRKSLKGWTGPNTTAEWLAVARDYWHPIACHTRRMAKGIVAKLRGQTKGHWECAGAAIYRANTCVRPFPNRGLLQLPKNEQTVFESPMEFEAHHGKGIMARKANERR